MKDIGSLSEEKTTEVSIRQKVGTIATELGEKTVEMVGSTKYGCSTYQFQNLQFRYYWWSEKGELPGIGVDVEENGLPIYHCGSTNSSLHIPGDWEKDAGELYKKAILLKRLREFNYPKEDSTNN